MSASPLMTPFGCHWGHQLLRKPGDESAVGHSYAPAKAQSHHHAREIVTASRCWIKSCPLPEPISRPRQDEHLGRQPSAAGSPPAALGHHLASHTTPPAGNAKPSAMRGSPRLAPPPSPLPLPGRGTSHSCSSAGPATGWPITFVSRACVRGATWAAQHASGLTAWTECSLAQTGVILA